MAETGNCIFCDIVAGKAEAHLIHEDELSLGLLDINPLAQGHCLIIPKRNLDCKDRASGLGNQLVHRCAEKLFHPVGSS